MSKTAIGYVRVSTEEQANEGLSLGAQEDRLRAYCTMRGIELTTIITDAGVSAHKPISTRTGGNELLCRLNSGEASAVVAFKLDRLFRNCADCLQVVSQWDKQCIALHLVDMGGQTVDTSSAMGRFFLTIMAGAAELERNLISERTKTVMSHMKAQGKRVGELPYGYSADETGQLMPDVYEQVVLNRIHDLQRRGLSSRKIALELECDGLRNRAGNVFSHQTVYQLMRRMSA